MTLYRYVGPQGQLREQGQKSSPPEPADPDTNVVQRRAAPAHPQPPPPADLLRRPGPRPRRPRAGSQARPAARCTSASSPSSGTDRPIPRGVPRGGTPRRRPSVDGSDLPVGGSRTPQLDPDRSPPGSERAFLYARTCCTSWLAVEPRRRPRTETIFWLSANGCGWVEARSAGRRGVRGFKALHAGHRALAGSGRRPARRRHGAADRLLADRIRSPRRRRLAGAVAPLRRHPKGAAVGSRRR